MIKQNFLRNINKKKGYYFISFFGLVLGVTTFILVYLFVNHEFKYDTFNKHASRIIRIVDHVNYENSGEIAASCPYFVAIQLKLNYPDLVEEYVRFVNDFNSAFIIKSKEDRSFYEKSFAYVDSTLFKVFDYEFIYGNPENALDGPNKIVLTESAAKKYFGNENPINKTLTINDEITAQVTAVVKNLPSYSHYRFDLLCSMQTILSSNRGGIYTNNYGNPFWTYILLKKGVTVKNVENILDEFAQKYTPVKNLHTFTAQELTSIHLHSNLLYEIGEVRNINYILLLITVAVLVLLMSLINYINLSISQVKSGLKEISIKKIIGISRIRLFLNVVSEVSLLGLISIIISTILAWFIIKNYSGLISGSVHFNELITLHTFSVLLILLIGFIIISSIYPTIILFTSKPINIIKKRFGGLTERIINQKILVVIQFLFSIFLVTGSIITLKQVNYLKEKPLGFKKDNMLILNIHNTAIAENVYTFLDDLKSIPEVKHSTYMEFLFGYDYNTERFLPESENNNDVWQLFPFIRVQEDFIKTFDIDIIQGRDFNTDIKTDYTEAVLINEEMVKQMGWTNENAIGKKFRFKNREQVIGVFKNYHNYSLHSKIAPMVIDLVEPNSGQQSWATNYVAINIDSHNKMNTINKIQTVWNKVDPAIPFNYTMLDGKINNLYTSEITLERIILIITIITIILASIGIFSLSIKIAKSKTKEIGIRKVIGARSAGILVELNKEFIIWVFIALIFSYPLSFKIMNKWLNNFAYKTDFNWWIFVFSGIVALLISMITVSFQSWKASNKNPVEALRYE